MDELPVFDGDTFPPRNRAALFQRPRIQLPLETCLKTGQTRRHGPAPGPFV